MTLALDQLTDDQREIVDLVRQFADERIIPIASEYEHKDAFPDEIVEGLGSSASSASRSRRNTAASDSTSPPTRSPSASSRAAG
jgi:hypothetical protein